MEGRSRLTTGAVAGTLLRHLPLVTLLGLYIGSGFAVQAWRDLPGMMRLIPFSSRLLLTVALYLAGAAVFHGWWIKLARGGSVFDAAAWEPFARRHFTPSRLVGLAVVVLLLPPFMSAFWSFKSTIPALRPFAWDVSFMRLDLALHAGRHPWEWLQPILGAPLRTRGMDLVYLSWFHVVAFTVVWQAWAGSEPLRTRFLLAYAGCWIVLGTAGAIFFSSAGPCYYGPVTGAADPYVPLMDYLRDVSTAYDLTALRAQRYLWEGYLGRGDGMAEGISAMPSLHIAMVTLFALLGWRVHRVLGVLYTAYAILIFLGSIHLGWHYAVDGYASALLAPVLWAGAGRATAAWSRRSGGAAGADG